MFPPVNALTLSGSRTAVKPTPSVIWTLFRSGVPQITAVVPESLKKNKKAGLTFAVSGEVKSPVLNHGRRRNADADGNNRKQ